LREASNASSISTTSPIILESIGYAGSDRRGDFERLMDETARK
jgi:hypothetical protein